MVRVIDAEPGVSSPMTEEEAKDFMANINGNFRLLVHLGMVDDKGEPNVTPAGYYFDKNHNKIYITTGKNSKKVHNLRTTNNFYSTVLMIPIHHIKESEAREKSKFWKMSIIIFLLQRRL
jgi:nitroimidazol reductase NimA-like FMN-containing flavoprotein (pyridoxamine 5'-phosphate oxidase superfamily)